MTETLTSLDVQTPAWATLTKHETTPGVECPAWCTDHYSALDTVDDTTFEMHRRRVGSLLEVILDRSFGDRAVITIPPLIDDLIGTATDARELAAELLQAADLVDAVGKAETCWSCVSGLGCTEHD